MFSSILLVVKLDSASFIDFVEKCELFICKVLEFLLVPIGFGIKTTHGRASDEIEFLLDGFVAIICVKEWVLSSCGSGFAFAIDVVIGHWSWNIVTFLWVSDLGQNGLVVLLVSLERLFVRFDLCSANLGSHNACDQYFGLV